jgi:hypothetical protein
MSLIQLALIVGQGSARNSDCGKARGFDRRFQERRLTGSVSHECIILCGPEMADDGGWAVRAHIR